MSDAPTETPSGEDRLAIPLAVLLAGLGLLGALIAWRVGSASDAASNAAQAGIIAARARTAAEATADGLTAQAMEAWLEYERAARRADALRDAGFPAHALEASMQAAAHWFLVRPEYIDEDGDYDPVAHRESYLAEAASSRDLDAEGHFARAAVEEDRIRGLLLIGVLTSTALPVLTVAQFARGRLRRGATVIGATVFVLGAVLTAFAWL